MKKFLSILFLLLASITLPLVTFESKALTNQSTENAAFNDITPLLISASETSVFALNASDNFVYEITNNTMVKTNINGQISKMKYHHESVYYSVENQLFIHTLSTTSTSLIASFTEQIVDFVINENNVYVLTSTTLFSLSLSNSSITTISSVFTNAKAITINQNIIYIIDVNKLYSINQSVVVLLGIISQQATSSYEIIALQDNLLVLEKPKNTINLFTYKGGLVANSLDSTSDIVTRTFKSGEVFSTDSFCKQNDKIIICDSIAKSIQAFTLNQNKLVFSTLIVASKGADTNRLNHAQDFDLINSEVFVFADTDNNRVTITDYKTNKSFEVNNLFNVPTIVAVNNLQEVYVYDNNYLTKILSDNTKQEIALPFIVADIVCDTLSNTYLFNASNNKVVKMIESTFEDVATIENATNLQMCINASATTLYVLHNDTISLIDLNTTNVTSITLNSAPISIAVDYKNNIYTLTKSSLGYTLSKISEGQVVDSKDIQTNDKLIKLNIDLHTGKFYALNDTLCCLTNLDVNFAENLLSFTSQTSYFNVTPLDSEVEVYSVLATCQAYKYPFNVSPILALDKGDKVIMLNSQIDENEKFAYCLITGKANTNTVAYIQKSVLEKVSEQVVPEYKKIKVITAIANVYKYPTTKAISVNDDSVTCNLTTLQLKRDEQAEILSYAYGLTDINGTQFMCIKLEDGQIVYINKNTAINSELDAEKYNKVFQPNGKLVSPRQLTIEGFALNEQGYYTKITTFESGRLIYLENAFDTNKEYTKIVYLNSNNEQVTAYVLTRFVDPDDITTPQIIGLIIMLFVILSSTTLIIILVKNRKPKIIIE